jgi:hypothetical protein
MREGIPIDDSDRLLGREALVHRALAARNPLLATAYLRIVEMARPAGLTDELAPMLAAHLCREVMDSLPFEYEKFETSQVPYYNDMMVISKAWPAEARAAGAEMPPKARRLLLGLLAKHDRSAARASRTDAIVRGVDPAAAGYANPAGLDRWAEVQDLAVGKTHFPRPARARDRAEVVEIAEALTDVLYGLYAPFPAASRAIDDILRVSPDTSTVRKLAAMLTVPGRAAYFFEVAPTSWLPTIAATPGQKDFFKPPDLRAVPLWVRLAPWPAGEYLVRCAADYPAIALENVWRGSNSANPWVLRCVADVLVAVPPEIAAKRLATKAAWPTVDQPLDPFAARYVSVALRLLDAGETDAGERLASNVVLNLCPPPGDPMIDYALAEALERISSAFADGEAGRLAKILLNLVRPALKKAGVGRGTSTEWILRFDHAERHPDSAYPSRILRALFEAARRAPDADLACLLDGMLPQSPCEETRRLGLALLAARPGIRQDLVNEILRHPSAWYTPVYRREFRDLAAATFDRLARDARAALVDYAASAAEADAIRARSEAAGWPAEPTEFSRARWQSHLLGRVAESLTPAETARLAPGFPVAVPKGEPEFFVVREYAPESPLSAAQIAESGPGGFADFAAARGPMHEEWPLGAEIRTAVADHAAEWADGIRHLDDLSPRLAYHVVLGFQDALKAGTRANWPGVLEWMSRMVAGDPDASRDVALASCWLLTDGLRGSDPHLRAGTYGSGIRLAEQLLDSLDPSQATAGRMAEGDPLTAGLNCVRGNAVVAAAWLLYRARGRQDRDALEARLLNVLSTERSPAVWSSVGRALPVLLDGGVSDPLTWAASLLADGADERRRGLVWDGYVATWPPVGAVIAAASYRYARSAAEGDGGAEPSGLVSPRERLGQHLVRIAVGRWSPDADTWLESFYEASGDETHARTTRYVADHLVQAGLPDDAADRVLGMLQRRLAVAGPTEMRSIGWAARSSYRLREAFETLVLPAIIGCGGTDDSYGAIAGMVTFAPELPAPTAAALGALLKGDQYGALLGLHGDEIEAILASLLHSDDASAQAKAKEIVNRLASGGIFRYAQLVDDME